MFLTHCSRIMKSPQGPHTDGKTERLTENQRNLQGERDKRGLQYQRDRQTQRKRDCEKFRVKEEERLTYRQTYSLSLVGWLVEGCLRSLFNTPL